MKKSTTILLVILYYLALLFALWSTMWRGPGGDLFFLSACALLPLVPRPRRLAAKCGAGLAGLVAGAAIALALAYPFTSSQAPLMPRGVPLLLGMNLPALGAIAGVLWFTFWARRVESTSQAHAGKRQFVMATGALAGATVLVLGGILIAKLFLQARDSRVHRAGHGKLDEIVAFVESHPGVVTDRDSFGKTPLHGASGRGNKDVVELLVRMGADVNAAEDVHGNTPLHNAARAACVEVAEELLAHGADVNAPDKEGRTPLHAAVMSGKPAIVKALLDHRADVNARDDRGRTPLRCALEAWHHSEEIASLVRSHGGVE